METVLQMILMLSFAASLVTGISMLSNQTDMASLLAFKDSINQDPFGFLSSWNQSVPVCKWPGIKCEDQRLVELDLRSKGLGGSISPSIGNLTFLRSIYLQDNRFHGNIPSEISHLSRLQNLNFTNNLLQGEIPSNLSHCLDLRVVEINFNFLGGRIPETLGSLSKLTRLSLYSNNLHGTIPSQLGNLSLLEILSLGTNHLQGTIPESVGNLRNLKWFGIGLNNVSGRVPASVYNISTLTDLVIPYNQLTGSLPLDIGLTLRSLRIISVGGNLFTGRFPPSFANASGMRILDLSVGGFSGPVPSDLGKRMNDLRWLNLGENNLGTGVASDTRFFDSLTNCSKLQILALYDNGFGGKLPESITNLSTQLRRLEAYGNRMVGTIPPGISKYVNLVSLDLGQNFLSGSIPLSIGKLQKLQTLSFGRNQLSGLIPESISNLTEIFQLNLEENNLTGSFPQGMENIHGLESLNLSHNSLDGSVPETIGSLSSLSFINLAHNSFSGSLPSEFGSLMNLQELDISNNHVSGEVPSTLGNCLRLERLLLGSNFLQGRIPTSFSALKGLVDLDLSHNNLSGLIPEELERLPYLQKLNLSFNNLEGNVPNSGAFTNMSVISIAGNQKLCGGVPELHLSSCAIQEESSKQRSHFGSKVTVIVITSGVSLVLLILLFMAIYQKRSSRKLKLNSTSDLETGFFRISYGELLTATQGFSSENLLGTGSFGRVYKGTLHNSVNPVAVKVFDLEKLGASESFIKECETLRKTRHRNLLKIITCCSSINFEGNNFKALVFEFMPNGNLDTWLHTTRKLNLIQRLNIAIDVASALEYLHHNGETPIAHCDLKPSNVLLDENLIAHVGDFGLAKFLKSDFVTNSSAVKGSIGYIAPEYGMGGRASIQGDIYSFGIVLLELVTGKRPTDEIFNDGMSLHGVCKMALPGRVMEIADPSLLILEDGIEECLGSLMKIGVGCSIEAASERLGISEVLKLLNTIKQVYVGSNVLA